jgi:hypothetical protein
LFFSKIPDNGFASFWSDAKFGDRGKYVGWLQ